MEKKYFPIQTDTACQLKWAWSTLYLYSGDTASCHRTGWSTVSSEDFDTFHNTSKKVLERQLMLEGQWPLDSCQYCRDIEASGGVSDRMFHNSIPDLSPLELNDNLQATVVTPTILEVYFNNTCNLSCVYCLPSLSSKINSENKKFGMFESNGVSLKSIEIAPSYKNTLDKFWNWFSFNSIKLKRFHVLGGEPFYQQEFDKCIEYFESTNHPDLEWGIVTNLMMPLTKLELYVERFKKLLIEKRLKRIELTCSIDGWGQSQEYVRWGLELDKWQQNFEYLLKQKWLTVNINQTISLLTIKNMPELLIKLNTWRAQRPIGQYFSVVTPQPTYLHPNILGPEIFKDDFKEILSLMPNNINYTYMEGIANDYAKSSLNQLEILKMQTYLNEIDRRRNTNWKNVFPWLAKELENVVQ